MSEAKFTGHLLPTTITYDPKTGKCKEVLASHATESAAPDTLHFCAACWAGNHGSCSGDKCGCAHDSASVSTAQLDAEDQHRAAEQPVGDVVWRMCKAFPCSENVYRHEMTAALAVAREGYWSQEDVEKAILAQARGFQVIPVDELAEFLKQALAPKPSLDCQWSAEVTPEELDAAMVNYPKMDREAIFRIVSDYQAARNKRLLPKTKS